MSVKNSSDIKGIKIKTVNLFLMIVACLLCVMVFVESFLITERHNIYKATMDDYVECNKAINELRNASDYLTSQATLYAVNLDSKYLDEYFKETFRDRKRETSLEVLELSHNGDACDINMKLALKESLSIQQSEYYSIRLILESQGVDFEELPEVLQTVVLSPKDRSLSAEDKLIRARQIFYDISYNESKKRVIEYTSAASASLVDIYLRQSAQDEKDLSKMFMVERILIITLFIVSLTLFIFLAIFVLTPLHQHIKCISEGQRMYYRGAYELRYIAKTYNGLLDKNEIRTSILRHKAEHDPLTGLINREGFDHIKTILADSSEMIAYLIIDIDLFKSINDKYGHLTGDEVLKKIALLLSEQFRNTDYVARIGGDEFAVIMTKCGDSPEDIIQSKIQKLNKMLQNKQDDLPSVSLSVGVSLSECGYVKEMEEQADKALYRVKRGGRCNCSFYDAGLTD